ncbi:hypothetical protein [Solimicrobium silvestre]|uniref:Uncharacterized protein n=1 Tax=Solimicrobium silvestre TaxID=2099400 RepID=A0A2S9GSQ0_9BURK|nr:hypothetical protein [Solimicrobium silvestre]PRC90749.1 hypothetical protein S2091_4575 [Solimicrobium silvestre]
MNDGAILFPSSTWCWGALPERVRKKARVKAISTISIYIFEGF